MLFELLSFLGAFLQRFFFAGYMSGGFTFPKPLSGSEEAMYVDKMLEGDMQAREVLIERNLRLVAHVVKKYAGTSGTDQDDLISIGTIGLIKAIDSFDNSKKIRLATYAARCIHNEILMHFRAMKNRKNEISLDDPVGTDGEGNSISLLNVIHEETEEIEERLELKAQTEKMYAILNQYLDAREREIIIRRFGLNGEEEMTQREIASQLNISRSYVSRIEKKAMDILREHMVINKEAADA